MATLRQKRLAKNLRNSKSMKEAMIKSNYSESYANASTQLKETIGYQEEIKPLEERLRKELFAIHEAMELKDKKSEEYKVLVDASEKVFKQLQLIQGKPTERTETIFDDEQIKNIARRTLDGDKSGEEKPD